MSKTPKINQLKARIEVECAKRDMSVAQFARLVGRTPQALNDLVNRNNPRLDTIREFAAALEMTMDEFVKPVTVQEYGMALIPRVA